MSYLTSPRLSFAGRFVADVSTINNVDADTTNNAWDPGWNSVGTGAFDFLGCKVTGAWTPLGPAADDPVSRYAISGRPDGASAKMVARVRHQTAVSGVFRPPTLLESTT
jgi:hypothetical protein